MKIAKNDKDKVVLFIELISLFEKFLTTKNPETNKSILRKAGLDEQRPEV